MVAAAQTGAQLRRRKAGRVHFHRAFLRTVAEPGTDGALPLPLLHLPQPLPALPDAVPFRRYGPQGNLPGNLSELLDAFPLEKIPVGEARKRYDNEIYDYLTQETHSEESDDGLIYRIFDVNAERIRLAIKDANTPFEGLTACIRTDDTRMFCRVEADGYVDARGETFSLSSRDGSLLPVSGKIVAPDGTELAYAASASNKEISVTCYDKAEIAWLHALAEAGTGVRIGSAECSLRFAVSAPLICHRVLTLRRDAACGLPRFTGEITFFRGDDRSAPVVIDRRTRPENRYRSHRLFQPITQAPLKAPETPYILFRVRRPQGLGDHRQADERRPLPRRIRPPVDQKPVGHLPVRRGMQDAAGLRGTHPALVRQMGPETVGNAPPYAPPDGSTEHIPYIFCLSNRTTFVLRIFHEDFVARIRDRSVCDRYIAGKDDFRVGKLSLRLESAEYYEPNSKLSLLELELADGQSAVPAKGSLAITLKHEMQPAQLSFTGESRGPSTMLVNVCCAGIDLQGREARFLVPDSGMPLAKGLYLRAPGSTAHLCIRQTPQPVQWCVELELRAELRFPESGEIGFEEFPGVMFGFRNLTVGGTDGHAPRVVRRRSGHRLRQLHPDGVAGDPDHPVVRRTPDADGALPGGRRGSADGLRAAGGRRFPGRRGGGRRGILRRKPAPGGDPDAGRQHDRHSQGRQGAVQNPLAGLQQGGQQPNPDRQAADRNRQTVAFARRHQDHVPPPQPGHRNTGRRGVPVFWAWRPKRAWFRASSTREASISSAAGSPARNPSRWDSG